VPPEVLAVAAAVCFGSTLVANKLALRDTQVLVGVVVTAAVAWVVLAAAVLLDPPAALSFRPTALFVIGGLIGGPGIAGAVILVGVDRLGASVHGPLQAGGYGILAMLGGALLLKEGVGPLRVVGTLAIILGAVYLARRDAEVGTPVPTGTVRGTVPPVEAIARTGPAGAVGATPPGRQAGRSFSSLALPTTFSAVFRPGAAFPLLAASGLAAQDVIVKSQLDSLPEPTFAAMVSAGSGMVFWAIVFGGWRAGSGRAVIVGRSGRWFLVSGFLLGLAYALLTHALRSGDVSAIGPILAGEPLVVLTLSAVFLRRLERLTITTLLAGTLVVAGTILVSL
jgi:drug/metabolite transporter (DMT)-like permease